MDQRKIKQAFRYNAAFSGLSGSFAVIFSAMLRNQFEAPGWLFPSLGCGLIGFAGYLYWQTRRREVSRSEAFQIIAADVLWVLGCVDLVMFDFVEGSVPVAITLGSSVVVALFAFVQLRATVMGQSPRSV